MVVGASGGLGGALLDLLKAQHKELGINHVIASYNSSVPTNKIEKLEGLTVEWHRVDLTSENSIAYACEKIEALDWFVNCAGVLHYQDRQPEKTISQLDPDFFNYNITVNSQATLMFAKHLKHKFTKGSQTVFTTVSAKVGSIEDNKLGGWYSYRISKASLNMALRCLAVEWQHSLPSMRVAAYHPGTTDTALSKPFQKNVPAKQLLSKQQSAKYFLDCITKMHEFPSGQFFSWNQQTLPW